VLIECWAQLILKLNALTPAIDQLPKGLMTVMNAKAGQLPIIIIF